MNGRDEVAGYVAELWRYPVKSMQGERVSRLEVLQDGIAHDRRYAFVSSGAPAGKPRLTSRERAAMLRFRAVVRGDRVAVTVPDGSAYGADSPELQTYLESHLPQQNRIALEHDPGAPPYTDVRPVAMLSMQAIDAVNRGLGRKVDARRFRANLLLAWDAEFAASLTAGNPDAFPEDMLAGRTLAVGSHCQLRLLERIPRCRVVTLDPDNAEPDPALMKYLDRQHGGRCGIYAAVVSPGPVECGDPLRLVSAPTASAAKDATAKV